MTSQTRSTQSTNETSDTEKPTKKQVCRKSTATVSRIDPHSIVGIRRTSTVNPYGQSQRFTRLCPRNPVDRAQTERLRQNFNNPTTEPIRFGVGIGKGGIRRMAARMRRRQGAPLRFRELRNLKFLHNSDNSIALAPFCRLVREIFNELTCGNPKSMKIQLAAFMALRSSAESFMVDFFEKCAMLTNHGNRVTLMPKDVALAIRVYKNIPGHEIPEPR